MLPAAPTPVALPSLWNHFHSAASTATLTNAPASPFPPSDLHFEYSPYVEGQQRRASRMLDLRQYQPVSPPKKSLSTPASALSSTLTSPIPSPHSPAKDATSRSKKRNTLQRLHTYHEGFVRRKKTRDVESSCSPPLEEEVQKPGAPRHEIWARKAVPAGALVSSPKSFNNGGSGVSAPSARITTTSAPLDNRENSPQFSPQPLTCSPEPVCTLPQSGTALEQRHKPQGSRHPEPSSSHNGIRRTKSDLNCITSLPSHEARPRDTNHGPVTQSMYAYGYSQAGVVEPISPPSSPDLTEHLNYDVSPIDDEDEDWDFPQRYFLRNEESSPTSKLHHQHTDQHTDQDSSDKSPTRSRASSTTKPPRPRNNIPAMRRERRKLQDAAATKVTRGQKIPSFTQSEDAGSPPQNLGVGPEKSKSSGPQEVMLDSSHLLGSTTVITANNQHYRRPSNPSPSFGERMRQFGKGKPEPIESRPAWNGASGRQVVIEPLRDDLNAAPLKVPTQHSKRPHRRSQGADVRAPETSYSTSAAAAVRKFMPSRSGQTTSGNDFTHVQPAAASYGASSSVPLDSGASTRNEDPPHETPRNSPALSGAPRPDYFDQERAIKRKPPPSTLHTTLHAPTPSHAAQPSISSSVYSTHAESRSRTESPQLGLIASDASELTGPWVQPPPPPAPAFSSESTTPSTSSPASPGSSPETELATVGGNSLPSVMDRRRPLRGKDTPPETPSENPIVISLRTAAFASSKADVEKGATVKKSNRSPSIMSTTKDLPLAPPEMVESDDRVVVLNAKLMGLAHRRNNINRSIQQMTELMPKDMLLTSAEVQHKREDEKRKVDILKDELADIQQQEFDLGLKLHRANKRRERESEYEESGSLWIRRITG